MSGDVDLEAELDRLYQLPVGHFVGERNELARRLKAAGETEEAGRVKSLTRPPVSAWVVNRLCQLAPEPLRALRRAGLRLRRAQQGGLGPQELRSAMAERRGVAGELLVRAEALLAEAGHAASTGTLLRVSKTLEALAAYGDDPPDPPPGRLGADLEPPGIEALTVLGVAAPGARRARPAPGSARREPAGGAAAGQPRRRKPTGRQLAKARERVEEARRQVAAARRSAKAAATQVTRAVDREAAARSTLQTIERQAEAARQRLKAARMQLEEKRSGATEAEQAQRLARRALAEAEQQLEELEPG